MESGKCFSNVPQSDPESASTQAKLFAVPSNLVAVGILFVSLLINGCSSGPQVVKIDISTSDETTAPASVTKANVGIYYEPEFTNYVHIQTFSDSIQTRNIGKESVGLFNAAIPKVFENTQVVDKLPPYDISRSEMDGIVEPRLDYLSWRTFFYNDVEFFHIEYTFMFYTSEGVPISSWTIVGTGSDVEEQLADAAQKFVSGFDDAPETKAFREYLETRRVGKLSFAADEIEVAASIDEDNELGLPLKAGGIIPVRVSVKNTTDGEITGRGFDVRLIDACGKRLAPAFPLAVISRFEYMAALNASDPAIGAAIIGGVLGSVVMMGDLSGQDRKQVENRKRQAEYFEKLRLKEVTLAKGEPIEGTLYFALPYEVTELNDATLSFWFIDPSVANGVTKEVSLSGIDYRRSPQLEQQRSSLVKAGAVFPNTSSQNMGSTCSSLEPQEAKSPIVGNTAFTSPIPGEELRILINGNTFSGKNESGTGFDIYNALDGTIYGRLDSGTRDTGVWKLFLDDQYCRKLRKWRDGEWDCFQISTLEGNKFRMKAIGKSYESIFTVREGDPEKLGPDDPEVQPPSWLGLSGTYVSDITTSDRWYFRHKSYRKMEIILEQDGNKIIAVDETTRSKAEGKLKGDTIEFQFFGAVTNNYEIRGKWTINGDGKTLVGTWHSARGTNGGQWNLKKVKGAPARSTENK